MKTAITSLLLLVALIMFLAWLLPTWATLGIIAVLLVLCIAILGNHLKLPTDNGTKDPQ